METLRWRIVELLEAIYRFSSRFNGTLIKVTLYGGTLNEVHGGGVALLPFPVASETPQKGS
ncbi:hypothetical protein ACLMAL_02590 [Nocardia sp. CWNU-33]|uniref:hypothetical protein n=1 Tax=Nocardia sp. CWNU-33 TaxID=3392117 RepID=UPI00398E7CE1